MRVADFTWVVSGPYGTRILADQGAEVIKIEARAEAGHTTGRWGGIDPADELGGILPGHFNNLNRSKLGITLNLNDPKGQEVAKALVRVSDVVVENFSAGVMKRWHLDYESLVKVKPDIIMISMAGMGHSGPWRDYVSHALTIQAMAGITDLTGFPDGETVGMASGYADYASGIMAALAVLEALDFRFRTGKGQYIDMSQLEANATLLDVAILELAAKGKVRKRTGNRLPHRAAAPHGVYPCKGEDRWCVVAVFSEEEWKAFCQAIGNPGWTRDSRFSTLLGRLENADGLDQLVEQWTKERSAEEVMETLQRAGVAAGVVQNGQDLLERDPQLKARGFYEEADHPEIGRRAFEGVPFKLSATAGRIHRASPLRGEHNDYVYAELLGMTEDQVNQFILEGVF